MGQTSPCVLGLFLLMSLSYSGYAEDVVLTLEPNWSTFVTGESVTFICDVKEGEETDWEYRINQDNRQFLWYHSYKQYTLQPLQTGNSGKYQCFARRKGTYEVKSSNIVSLTVSGDIPRATPLPGETTIPVGGSVTLSCSVDKPADWRYYWYRRTSGSYEDLSRRDGDQNREMRVSQGGIYWCRGGRGNPVFYTHGSYEVTIEITFSNRVTLTSQPSWSQMFSGETITLTCNIQGGGGTEWLYEWTTSWSTTHETYVNYWSTSALYSGEYKCRGRNRRDSYSTTQWSKGITKRVSPKPKAQLRADVQQIPVGGSVTLSCFVKPSAGWIYSWYRGDQYYTTLTRQDAVFLSSGRISVSQGGLYRCRGGRGSQVYYSEYSDSIRINNIAPNRVVVTLQPNWPEIYRGETITVSCEIQGGDTEWTYEWETSTSLKPRHQHEYRISPASSSHSGDYRCRGTMKSDRFTTTEWSDSVRLTVYDDKPRPVLTVSPSWLSPGASVTLKCEVGLQSAGWRFFWSKAVPDPSQLSYSSELLPGSSNGTEQDSYMVHGQTHTAGYVCQAGRGDPVIYTETSEPTFVWSGDVDPSASLTVSPDSAQHFTYDSVSLSCEGNSTEWRVRRFTDDDGYLSHCSSFGTMTGSICNMYHLEDTAVYWCESGSGDFSNAVNITAPYNGVILVSPVHPVAEGESVTLSCKLRPEEVPSFVFFYKDGKLVQNDTRQELTIPEVSKSHEGFYSCKGNGRLRSSQSTTSPESWLSVKFVSTPEDSSFSVPLIVGLVCGLLLIILLLLLFRCTKSKDSCCNRSQSTNQSPATEDTNKQAESQCLYELIKGPEDTGNGESRDDASSVEFKNVVNENLMYAQLLFHKKGKTPPPAANETVYSEIKVGSDP